jgi:hypothetical protein
MNIQETILNLMRKHPTVDAMQEQIWAIAQDAGSRDMYAALTAEYDRVRTAAYREHFAGRVRRHELKGSIGRV